MFPAYSGGTTVGPSRAAPACQTQPASSLPRTPATKPKNKQPTDKNKLIAIIELPERALCFKWGFGRCVVCNAPLQHQAIAEPTLAKNTTLESNMKRFSAENLFFTSGYAQLCAQKYREICFAK